VEGATVYINPNVMRIGTGIFGSLPKSPGEEPFQDIDFLPEPVYAAATDEEGVALLKNVPAFLTVLDIDHPEFQVPLRGGHGRNVRFELAPGETRTLDVILEMKGKDFIGDGGSSTR
jgi:hypothetical protein